MSLSPPTPGSGEPNNFGAIQSAILDEAREVLRRLLLVEANVRIIWKSAGGAVPGHMTAGLVTTASIGNSDPSGNNLYGLSSSGPSAAGVGDTAFDEVVTIYPASFLTPGGGSDVNAATNELVGVLASLQASDPAIETWIIRIFGRLLGETLSHELYHTLLPVPFVHNVDPTGAAVDTRDLMDQGSERTFLERTGIVALSSAPDDFINNLTDNGIGATDRLTNPAHVAHIHSHFPIPLTPPFDK